MKMDEAMTNEECWNNFICELREYVEVHHHCPNKHTTLLNQTKYYRKKQRAGKLSEEQSRELEAVLAMRDMEEHTGGRKTTDMLKINTYEVR